jgi:GTPase SAR1 family protein
MEDLPKFVSYKKVVIFGAAGTGKTTLAKYIEEGSFSNESPSEKGKKYNIINYIYRCRSNKSFRRVG